MNIGILALQGDVSEHVTTLEAALRSLKKTGRVIHVRRPRELENLSALLIPGGESSTISKQLDRFGLGKPIIELAGTGIPMMGTCAGSIILSNEILDQKGQHVEPLGLMNISVRRNAFGRQAESFERPLDIEGLGSRFPGVFIRAPRIARIGPGVESLAALDGEHVMVMQNNFLALTFHPELANDCRIHAMFLGTVRP